MQRSAKYKFMQQQGFQQESEEATNSHFDALLFQPIIVGSAMLLAIIFQSAPIFLIFSVLLWINTLFPIANPFERLYDVLIGKKREQKPLAPAPAPRRFMQGMAASLMLLSGITILTGLTTVSYIAQAFIAVAFALLLFGKFCVGAYIFHLITGNAKFANQTCPWSK
jgi:polyferredoxin